MEDIRSFFLSLKLSGSFTVSLLDPRHVFINLSNDNDYTRVFLRRSYYVKNFQMRLLKWSPDFDINSESPICPVWISLPNLRMHFYNHTVLQKIGSIFGRPLQVDQATANRTRPSVARILVEMDITKDWSKEIWLGSEGNGYIQKVEIENFPIFCTHCKLYGHDINNCFILNPSLKNKAQNFANRDNKGKEKEEPSVLHASFTPENFIETKAKKMVWKAVNKEQREALKEDVMENKQWDIVLYNEEPKTALSNKFSILNQSNIADMDFQESTDDIFTLNNAVNYSVENLQKEECCGANGNSVSIPEFFSELEEKELEEGELVLEHEIEVSSPNISMTYVDSSYKKGSEKGKTINSAYNTRFKNKKNKNNKNGKAVKSLTKSLSFHND
ncbi:hypothetical protein MA16_Dca028207 [Dendrobium catenatum]|uniref:DUF4283 domain-containing protein n=1 Tax=Dendrobium catenatum TaxID=906689 RepID=A0A2I0VBJ7_9ASPA|nr:hypothetical protein MA16_Dca028207 [Dendrobium catenatum]